MKYLEVVAYTVLAVMVVSLLALYIGIVAKVINQ